MTPLKALENMFRWLVLGNTEPMNDLHLIKFESATSGLYEFIIKDNIFNIIVWVTLSITILLISWYFISLIYKLIISKKGKN